MSQFDSVESDHIISELVESKAKIQAELLRRQAEMSGILEASSMMMGVVELGPEGFRLIFVNQAGKDYYGFEGDPRGKLLVNLGFPEPLTRQWEARYIQAKQKGAPVLIEFESFKKDKFFATTVNYIGVGSEGHDHYCFVTEDITHRRHEEERRIKNAETMAHFSKMSSLGEMAAGIAHETHNPLSIINGFAELMIRKLQDPNFDRDKMVAIAQEIKKTCARITSVMDGLRYFSGGGQNENHERCLLSSLIENTANISRERFRKYGVELELIGVDQAGFIDCRQTQISQVLLNLLNNAFDAVQDSDQKLIRIRVSESAGYINIDIEDSGKGISHDQKDKIFQPFYTTKPVGKGTGLGLSICKGIVESHQGKISLLSLPNEPAQFRIQLPKSLTQPV